MQPQVANTSLVTPQRLRTAQFPEGCHSETIVRNMPQLAGSNRLHVEVPHARAGLQNLSSVTTLAKKAIG